jgi:predicted TIM-barrel fold metal-dependent hydrolase
MAGRIDVHFHIIPQFYVDAAYAAGAGPAIGRYPAYTPELALEIMDASGIQVALTSISQPGVQFASATAGAALARQCNEYAAELRQNHPGRFGAFGLIPVQDTSTGLKEIDHCLDVLNFEGVCLFASYDGIYLGDPKFDPIFERLNAASAVIFVHPTSHPSAKAVPLSLPHFMLEFLFDTTRAATNMVMSGTLRRYRNVKVILAHAGGVMPYIGWRLSVAPIIDPRLNAMTPEAILAGLKEFWFDVALSPSAGTLHGLEDFVGVDRLLYGSDWPYAKNEVVARALKEMQGVDTYRRAADKIDRGNALSLFPHLASS